MKQVTRSGLTYEGHGRDWFLISSDGARSRVYNTHLLKKLRQASRTSKPVPRKRSNFRWIMGELQKRWAVRQNAGQDWTPITKGPLAGLERNLTWDLYRSPISYQEIATGDVVPAGEHRYLTGAIARKVGLRATAEYLWRREALPEREAAANEEIVGSIPQAVVTGKSWWKTLRWMLYRAWLWIRRK